MKSFLGINQESDRVGRTDAEFAQELQQAAAGDPASIRRLVVEFEPGLAGFARRRGVSEADSVVNAALSDAFRNLPTFRGTDRRAFRAYLYRILRRRIADDQRVAYAQQTSTLDIGSDGVSELVDQTSSSFDDRVVDRQLVDDILSQLTEEQREVLEMRVLSGLSIRETASRTGRSEVAVKAMQRRALLSLRSVMVVMGVLILCGLALAAVFNSRGPVTVIENGPAGISPDGVEGQSGEDEQGSPLVVETPTTTAANPSALALEAGDQAGIDSFVDQADSDGAESAAASISDSAATESTSISSDPTTETTTPSTTTATTAPPAPLFPMAPLPESLGSTPCSIATDGSPAVGEIAFATYRFNGAFTLFDKTSIDIIGPSNSSALIPGLADPAEARHGDVFPFVIGSNMMWDRGFAVNTTLAAGEVKTRCKIENRALTSPCNIRVDGVAERGDTALVIYWPYGKYLLLEDQPTHILGWSQKSMLADGESVAFSEGTKSEFSISTFMFRDGPFEARTSFADNAGHVVCKMADS